jgi:hypothetical protein
MQPTYLPWMGYFDLMDQVDKFVFFDDVKVSKQSWGVRNRIKTKQGQAYLTVPLKNYRDHTSRLFSNTGINYDGAWPRKHLKTITQAYSKAPFFKEVFDEFESIFSVSYDTIADLNIAIIQWVAKKIKISTETIRSSIISGIDGHKDVRLTNICRTLGADQYLSPQGSAVYIESERPGGSFPSSGISLFYHNFEHPEYPQAGSPFLSHMCILDLLMNCGYDNALKIIRTGRRDKISCMEYREKWLRI